MTNNLFHNTLSNLFYSTSNLEIFHIFYTTSNLFHNTLVIYSIGAVATVGVKQHTRSIICKRGTRCNKGKVV